MHSFYQEQACHIILNITPFLLSSTIVQTFIVIGLGSVSPHIPFLGIAEPRLDPKKTRS
jgi:hypothetical protein